MANVQIHEYKGIDPRFLRSTADVIVWTAKEILKTIIKITDSEARPGKHKLEFVYLVDTRLLSDLRSAIETMCSICKSLHDIHPDPSINSDDAQKAVNCAEEIATSLRGDPPKKSVECEFCRGALFVGFRGMDAPCHKCNSLKALEWFNDRLERAFAVTASVREEFEGLPTKDAWEEAKRTIGELAHERDMARKQLAEAREALRLVPD